MTRNIGLKVKSPKEEPREGDKKNPFNGTLPIRGKLFEGKVVKAKGKKDVPKDICQLSNNKGIIQTDSTKLSKRPHERLEII